MTNTEKTTKEPTKKKKKETIFKAQFNLDVRTVFIILFGILFLFFIYSSYSTATPTGSKAQSITKIIRDIQDNKVKEVAVSGNNVTATYKDGTQIKAVKESSDSFIAMLRDSNVDPQKVPIIVEDTESGSLVATFLVNLIPTLIVVGILYFLFRQARGAQDSVFSFGQSRAKRFNKDLPKVNFKDIAGIDEAKRETEEIVDFLKNPEKYRKVGARTPKGVLFVGPAGTGKTLLAKAVAGEANVPFFSIAGSEFMEMLVGIGAARVRDLFQTAKKNAPSIIFIDEIDAIGRARSTGVMPAHDEREQTLNQILVEMDGFTPNEQVVVIAATNRGDLLDPALLRPGRFDRRIVVDYPDVEGRRAIIKIHSRGKPFEDNINWDYIADRTVGFSGADIENMLNEAAIGAARGGKDKISFEDIEEAATKVKLGPEKKRLQTDFDRKITAYHEAGHALVSHYLPHTDPVHRISIVSRGMALGFTLIPPGRDRLHISRTHLLERIMMMMGGRAAEEVVYNEVTTGASNDFSQATRIARAMVVEYGMSKLGHVNFGTLTDVTDLSRPLMEQQQLSQKTMSQIDTEIKKIVEECYDKAVELVKKHRKELDQVADALMQHENLDKDDFEKIVGKKGSEAKLPEQAEKHIET
jgi:cell division protease FtsH